MNNKKQRALPDFIGIGTQRSGSSWLYRRLGEHPELWLPPIKEIHFFDRLDATADARKKKFYKDFRNRYRSYRSPEQVPKVKRPNLSWDINYFFRPKNFIWYSSLFSQGADRVTGEVTPEYMTLSKEVVKKIYAHNPKMKMIFIMRDPIDRIWSAAARHFVINNKRVIRKIGEEELLSFVKKRATILRANYLRTLSVWESIFPTDQIHIDFFDNIQDNPNEVLLRIFGFLGVKASTEYMLVEPYKRVASSTKKAKTSIPHTLEHVVCVQNIDQLNELSQRFGGHTTKWLERAKKVLG
ncbi:MAG: sulfotransferase [Chloroflexi bacterium]|nr:sulfotransferase [Chloroflexota bacterium]